MSKERFPAHRKSKLQPQGDGPFQILERIDDNAYKVDLLGDDSRSNPFKERGDDADQPNTKRNHANNPLEVPIGSITRTRAKKLKEASNGLVQNI
jgi:hypothetical protein